MVVFRNNMKNIIKGIIVAVLITIVFVLLNNFFTALSKKNSEYVIKKYGVPTCDFNQEPECVKYEEQTKEGETAIVTVKYCVSYSCLPIY